MRKSIKSRRDRNECIEFLQVAILATLTLSSALELEVSGVLYRGAIGPWPPLPGPAEANYVSNIIIDFLIMS